MHHGYIEDCVRLVGDRHAAHLDVVMSPQHLPRLLTTYLRLVLLISDSRIYVRRPVLQTGGAHALHTSCHSDACMCASDPR